MCGMEKEIHGRELDEVKIPSKRCSPFWRFLLQRPLSRFSRDYDAIPLWEQSFRVWNAVPERGNLPPEESFIPGDIPRKVGQTAVLVCAHAAGKELFGGEWSFLDVLEALALLDFDVIVTFPEMKNPAYLKFVKKHVSGIYIFKYKWWAKNAAPSQAAIAKFESIIKLHHVALVHANTLMLREPLIAARNAGVVGMVHVLEMIRSDQDLASYIGLRPEDIVRRIRAAADFLIVNSAATAEEYGRGPRTFVAPNVVRADILDIPNVVDPRAIVFGLVGSNIKKKGIFDFLEIARLCEKSAPNAVFAFIGLESGPYAGEVKRLKRKHAVGKLPGNLRFLGYKETPLAAVSETNVVLNLSLFAESFGRSVAEAMAARRPVIAYAWGALPELVKNEVSGYLVPFRDVQAVAARVEQLCGNPELIQILGTAGRELIKGLSQERLAQRLDSIYAEALAHKQLTRMVEKRCEFHESISESEALLSFGASGENASTVSNQISGSVVAAGPRKHLKVAVAGHFFMSSKQKRSLRFSGSFLLSSIFTPRPPRSKVRGCRSFSHWLFREKRSHFERSRIVVMT